MNFQVPQFIEVEDKIFGPLTFKQFLYLVGGGGTAFIIYILLPKYLAIVPVFLVIALALALAFYKINERPFVLILEAAVKYTLNPKLYLWHQELKKIEKGTMATRTKKELIMPKLTEGKLHDLSWSLDVKETVR